MGWKADPQRKKEEGQESSLGSGVAPDSSVAACGTIIGMHEVASSTDVPIDDDDNSSATVFEDSEEELDGNSDDESRDDGISVGGEIQPCAAGKPLEEVMQLFEDSLVGDMEVMPRW